jgi:hypothetical protein
MHDGGHPDKGQTQKLHQIKSLPERLCPRFRLGWSGKGQAGRGVGPYGFGQGLQQLPQLRPRRCGSATAIG